MRCGLLSRPQGAVDHGEGHHIPGIIDSHHHQDCHHRRLRELQRVHPLQQRLSRHLVGQIAYKRGREEPGRHRGKGDQADPESPRRVQLRDAEHPRAARHDKRPRSAPAGQRRKGQEPEIPKHKGSEEPVSFLRQVTALRGGIRGHLATPVASGRAETAGHATCAGYSRIITHEPGGSNRDGVAPPRLRSANVL